MADVPAGMIEVSHDRFWELVMSEKRDIMPCAERNFTRWQFNRSQQPWGWCSQGFVPRYGEAERYAIIEGVAHG